MDPASQQRRFVAAGIFLGLGLGGFFDGIVLHQVLQWHHMVSHVDDYPTTTVAGLEANTLADGLFHIGTLLLTLVGIALLWDALRHNDRGWSTRTLVGLLLMGWGLLNVVEGIVDHHLLQLHHVREDAANQLAWDLAFLAWGVAMIIGGWLLARPGIARAESSPEPSARRTVHLP
jgi:uncharacterized membrane protein